MGEFTRQQMIDRMVRDDIGSIRKSLEQGDVSFLDRVLRGEGWTPYNQLSDEEVAREYADREKDIAEWEPIYDVEYGKERNDKERNY